MIDDSRRVPWRTLWLLSFGGWALLTLLGSLRTTQVLTLTSLTDPNPQRRTIPWSVQLGYDAARYLVWAVLAPFVWALCLRWPLTRRHLLARLPVYALVGAGAAVVQLVGTLPVGYGPDYSRLAFSTRSWRTTYVIQMLQQEWSARLAVFAVIVGAGHALDAFRRARRHEQLQAAAALQASRLEGQLAEARLGALQGQLQPHFLFNTLNAVSALVAINPDEAQRAIAALSDLLRRTLALAPGADVALADEFDWLDQYLALYLLRFGDWLTVTVEVEPALAHVPIPALLIQPLVENALRHGHAAQREGSRVWISAERLGDQARLRVEDDGAGLRPDGVQDGIGLRVTRERLQTRYGPASTLTLAPRQGGGTVCTVTLPILPAPTA